MAISRPFTQYDPAKSLGAHLGIVSADYPSEEKFQRAQLAEGIHAGIVGALSVAFLLLAFLVKQDATQNFDVIVGQWTQGTHDPPTLIALITQSPIYAWVMTNLSVLGNLPWVFVVYVAVFAGLFTLGLRLEAVIAVAGSGLAYIVGSLVRSLVDRARPSAYFLHVIQHVNGAGFPSGHVMMYVTLFGFAFYVVLIAWRRDLLKVVTLAMLGALVVFIGISRVYLGAHWPTDTFGAYLLSDLILAGMIDVHRQLLHRFEVFKTGRVTAPTSDTEPSWSVQS